MKSSSAIGIVLITAVFVGAGTYYFQDQRIQQVSQEMSSLTAQMAEMKTEIPKDVETPEVIESEEKEDASDLNLPVVVFEREGLLTDEMRQEVEDKIINPYFDYHNAEELDFIVMLIEVLPESDDYLYAVKAISKDGIYHGFLHGTRGEELDYYVPECMGACPFSDEYKKKYPHVVQEA